jgi:hypothetical protein
LQSAQWQVKAYKKDVESLREDLERQRKSAEKYYEQCKAQKVLLAGSEACSG